MALSGTAGRGRRRTVDFEEIEPQSGPSAAEAVYVSLVGADVRALARFAGLTQS